jgi:hypothetical protein
MTVDTEHEYARFIERVTADSHVASIAVSHTAMLIALCVAPESNVY